MSTVSEGASQLSRPGEAHGAEGPAPKVLVALADPAARREIATALADAPGLECVGEVASGAEAIARVKVGRERPRLVVLDGAMPDIDAVAVARRIVELRPEVRVVMLAVEADEERGVLALGAGALGYLNGNIGPETLLRVLRKVAEGEAAVPRALTARLLERMRELPGAALPLVTDALPTRPEVRLLLAAGAALVGIAGLAVALSLPNSAAEAGSTGVYVSSEYRLLLLVGSVETAAFAAVLGALTLLRPAGRAAQPILFVVVVLGVLVAIGTALVLADYIRALP